LAEEKEEKQDLKALSEGKRKKLPLKLKTQYSE
jgi:hypothetical protein